LTRYGIEPANFRLLAQHLNHCAIAVPYKKHKRFKCLFDVTVFPNWPVISLDERHLLFSVTTHDKNVAFSDVIKSDDFTKTLA
jgi:hypothetical protein